ncbi:hypothetical protein L596_018206 [Steinernema carpocapsae]|uniref:Uncharacterized protein n=1 Tax=Steinernema carpocapsae TaxID=34508 RepID=A0A4U5N401_STECR|nr:hypothetical protein L596_018206 [Steinernema carpocapsae]
MAAAPTIRSLLRLASKGDQRRLFCNGKVPQQQETAQPKASEGAERPMYMTSKSYKDTAYKNRFARSMDSSTGVRPTALQRRFLVITRMFAKRSDIPEFVAHGTMNRMHDRMRVVFIVVASVLFFSIFYVFELINHARIERDKRAGKVVTSIDG